MAERGASVGRAGGERERSESSRGRATLASESRMRSDGVLFSLSAWLVLIAGDFRPVCGRKMREVTEEESPIYPGLGTDLNQPVDEDSCPRSREDAAARGRMCLRKCKSDADCISSRKRCLCDGQCGWSCVRPDLHCDDLTTVENGHFKVTGDYFSARVTYNCQEGFWMSGPKERICQGDGSWSEQAPECRKKAVCGMPPQVPHARHTAAVEKGDYDIDEMVQYNCFPGYDAKGFARAKCLFYNGTAQWFGPDLKCIPRSCGHPGDVENGRREGAIFTFTSRVTYQCLDGYELVGRANRYCQSSGQWSGVLPACRPVQCTIPSDPENGRVLYSAVTFGALVKYECRQNYKLAGFTSRKCGANKQWEDLEPACELIDCGSPGVLHNGFLDGRSTTMGSVITFRCFNGMKFEGDSINTTCQKDGTWSHPLPKCYASCEIPELSQGRVVGLVAGSRVEHGQEIQVDCKPLYELSYNVTPAICRNGTWSYVPLCAPERCKQLPDRPRHGMVIAPKTEHGMRALFKCKDGFELEGENITECHFGKWTAPTPSCREIYCGFPGYLDNGRVLLVGHMGMYDYRPYVRKVTNNRQIIYECMKGFILPAESPAGATCVAGHWSPLKLPKCVQGSHPHERYSRSAASRRRKGRTRFRRAKDPCPPIPEAPWMEVEILRLGKGNATMPHGTVVNVTCSRGYQLNIGSNRTAKCAHGHWKPDRPECLTVPCHVPKVEHGLFHLFQDPVDDARPVGHGDLVTLTCAPGFRVTGAEALRCWYGEWATDTLPDCVPGPCELPTIADGSYSGGYRSGLTIAHGSSVEFACRQDYIKQVEEPVRCVQGKLKPAKPSCAHPDALANAAASATGQDIQETDIRYRGSPAPDPGAPSPPSAPGQPEGQRSCTFPERLMSAAASDDNGHSATDEEEDEDDFADAGYPHGAQVKFRCIAGITGEKTSWEITCEDGSWVGRAQECEEFHRAPSPPPEERRNRTCMFRNTEPNLVTFLGDRRILEELSEFSPGTELVFRCRDIGKFSMSGSRRRRCLYGDWDGAKPSCFGLSQENDYAQKPPTILFRHQLGSIAQSNEGQLIVYPGTILHLECLWIRKYGTPKWEISHSYRKYPEAWTNEIGRDPQLEFRLSIYHAQKDDSGKFTCVSPMGHQHSVDIVVAAVHCPELDEVSGLHASNPSTRMNTKVVFSCRDGQTLNGSEQTTCLPSGNWSSPTPSCTVTECPDMSNSTWSSGLEVTVGPRLVGSAATFSCPKGYGLRGSAQITCLDTGQWSDEQPSCIEVICEMPEVPEQGYLQGPTLSEYRASDVVQFACNTGYMMDGMAIAVCQETGRWSAQAPQCVPACTYPGTTSGANIVNVKFFYRINETVTFDCADGYELRGAKMLRCLEDGRWSSAIPTCHQMRKKTTPSRL